MLRPYYVLFLVNACTCVYVSMFWQIYSAIYLVTRVQIQDDAVFVWLCTLALVKGMS